MNIDDLADRQRKELDSKRLRVAQRSSDMSVWTGSGATTGGDAIAAEVGSNGPLRGNQVVLMRSAGGRTEVETVSRRKPRNPFVPQPIGEIKIFFSSPNRDTNALEFFVGGDRVVPEKIWETDFSLVEEYYVSAEVTGTGRDDWIVGIKIREDETPTSKWKLISIHGDEKDTPYVSQSLNLYSLSEYCYNGQWVTYLAHPTYQTVLNRTATSRCLANFPGEDNPCQTTERINTASFDYYIFTRPLDQRVYTPQEYFDEIIAVDFGMNMAVSEYSYSFEQLEYRGAPADMPYIRRVNQNNATKITGKYYVATFYKGQENIQTPLRTFETTFNSEGDYQAVGSTFTSTASDNSFFSDTVTYNKMIKEGVSAETKFSEIATTESFSSQSQTPFETLENINEFSSTLSIIKKDTSTPLIFGNGYYYAGIEVIETRVNNTVTEDIDRAYAKLNIGGGETELENPVTFPLGTKVIDSDGLKVYEVPRLRNLGKGGSAEIKIYNYQEGVFVEDDSNKIKARFLKIPSPSTLHGAYYYPKPT